MNWIDINDKLPEVEHVVLLLIGNKNALENKNRQQELRTVERELRFGRLKREKGYGLPSGTEGLEFFINIGVHFPQDSVVTHWCAIPEFPAYARPFGTYQK